MAVADQLKSDVFVSHISNSPSKKLEKNGSRTRGSGSPFKCIGIGLAQQMKSERDEELTTARKRIEELEALAASRQKEVLMICQECSDYFPKIPHGLDSISSMFKQHVAAEGTTLVKQAEDAASIKKAKKRLKVDPATWPIRSLGSARRNGDCS
ncbi:hypothetical protein Lser_V15G28667 [Lactuca serriola]